MAKKEHRFWTWANGAWVKLKLREGDTLTWVYGGPHDEGFSWTEETWGFHYGDPEVIVQTCYTTSRDCDGPFENYQSLLCGVGDLKKEPPEIYRGACWCNGFSHTTELPFVHEECCKVERVVGEFARPPLPDWKRKDEWQRDHFAEAAGY